jgi:hypothetical protein
VWCDDAVQAPGFHAGFRLSASGQTIGLSVLSEDEWMLMDALTFGPQLPDFSIGRAGEAGDWTLTAPTPNASNRSLELGSSRTLKINEWMANPAAGDDWLELYNPDPAPVLLAGLAVTDSLGHSSKSLLPPLSFVSGHGHLQIFADNQQGGNHAAFRLSAAGGALGLFNTNGTLVDSVFYAAQASGVSEGRVPDGEPNIYSIGFKGTPGKSNFSDSNGDGLPDAWELANGLDPFARNNGLLDSDNDGLTNGQEFVSGSNPRNGSSKLRIESVQVGKQGSGTFLIRFMVEPGQGYTVQTREGVEAAPWQKLQDIPPQSARQFVEVSDANLGQSSARYYRVVTPMQP